MEVRRQEEGWLRWDQSIPVVTRWNPSSQGQGAQGEDKLRMSLAEMISGLSTPPWPAVGTFVTLVGASSLHFLGL